MFSPSRIALAGLAAITILLPALPAGASSDAAPSSAAPQCVAPRPRLTYSNDKFVWGMAVDYAGCNWWAGDSIRLQGSLRRVEAGNEQGAASVATCTRLEELGVPTSCEIVMELEHPAHEVARYRGEITYPWEDGVRTERLGLVCTSTGNMKTCRTDPTAS